MEHSTLFWVFNVAVACGATALTIYCARTRLGSGTYLCNDCRFNDPIMCFKKVRPYAFVCTSYREAASPLEPAKNTLPATTATVTSSSTLSSTSTSSSLSPSTLTTTASVDTTQAPAQETTTTSPAESA